MESEEFLGALKNDTPRPLPEDFAIRSLVYTEDYLLSVVDKWADLEDAAITFSAFGEHNEYS
ncbi:unnamed protein product [Clonostachys solani]|uniref:Uncharacterized protein n=1 Tax=Clonostachys solani TaxID=160281 RepID=A0A9N9ZEN1_9HYPO|nr:unnamed protein product [Clonostachys solani]